MENLFAIILLKNVFHFFSVCATRVMGSQNVFYAAKDFSVIITPKYQFDINSIYCYYNFLITKRHEGEVTNIKIQNDGDSYSLKGDYETQFPTLSTLVEYYMEKPKSIKEKNGGFIELLYPVRSTDPTSER